MAVDALTVEDERAFRQLGRRLEGELLTDRLSRYLYGTDASYHLIVPLAVARPRRTADLAVIAEFLSELNAARAPEDRIGLIMRSGGTSLTGGSIGRGLVVDVTKYFHRILGFDPERRRVRVEPGVTCDELDRFLSPYGLMFPPNPASGIACELGGMWANNASGTRHVKYGPTRDWVESLYAVSSSGETFQTGAVTATPSAGPRFQDPVQARWARTLWPAVRDGRELIARHTARVNKNSSGYCLERLWCAERFDFTQLLVGSEGTLALFAEAELRLARRLPHRATALLFFGSWEAAGQAVLELLPLEPVAVEMVDRHLLALARPRSPVVRDLVPLETEAALLVEFEGDDPGEVSDRIGAAVTRTTQQQKIAFGHRTAFDPREQERLWTVRKSAAMIGHLTQGRRKPVPFIEDCVVRPEQLPEYIRAIKAVFARHGVRVAYWGHAGNGNIHVRPALDLTDPADLHRMREITHEVFAIVDRFGGSYTAEHGDGYTHSHLLERKFGDLYRLYRLAKDTCDPLGFLNPDKIITARSDSLTSDLKMGPGDRIYVEAENEVVRTPEAIAQVENCVGLGVCKDFCPSFIGLRNEQDLTRGRTNAMRGMMTGAFGDPDRYLRTPEFRASGDTCLNCKRCAHQCPSQVDEPRHLLLARRYVVQQEGMPFAEQLLAGYERFAPWGVRLAGLTNRAARWPWLRVLLEWSLGIDRRRRLPEFAPQTLDRWFAAGAHPREGPRGTVVYFPGCFARYNQPQSVGRNTIRMAERLGFGVILPRTRCSAHALETYGGDITAHARHNIAALEETPQGAPILTTCSSCRLSLVKQYPEWFWNDPHWLGRAQAVAARVRDAAHFGAGLLSPHAGAAGPRNIAYHAPCHALALSAAGRPGGQEALQQHGGRAAYHEIEQRCSGMGGTFGFKRKNRTIMETNAQGMVGHLAGLPADTVVYTDCPSCRLALDEVSSYAADHPVNLVYEWLTAERGPARRPREGKEAA